MPYIPEGGVATAGGRGAGITRFQLGEDYARDTSVVYESGWYRARVDITDASEVPPLDLDNWEEFFAHGIESYGEHVLDEPGEVDLATATLAATGQEGGIGFASAALDFSAIAAEIENRTLSNSQLYGGSHFFSGQFSGIGDAPAASATVVNGQIVSHEDGLVLTAPAAEDFGVRVHLNHTFSNPTVRVVLQGRKNSGSWTDIKSATHIVNSSGATSFNLDLDNDSDVAFTLDEDDTLSLRWGLVVSGAGASIQGGSIQPRSGERLILETPVSLQTHDADVNAITGIPADIVTFTAANGRLQPETDGIAYTFPGGADLAAAVTVESKTSGDVTVTLNLQARKRSSGTWVGLKSGSATVSDTGVHNVTLTGNDVTFYLGTDDDDEMEFRWRYSVTSGATSGGSIGLQAGQGLAFTIERRAQLDFSSVVLGAASLNTPLESKAGVNYLEGVSTDVLDFTSLNRNLDSMVDGTPIIFHSGDDHRVQLIATWGGNDPTITLALQGRKVGDTDWTTIKSIGATVLTASDSTLTLTNSSSVSFLLDDTESLEFQYVYEVTSGAATLSGTIRTVSGRNVFFSINDSALVADVDATDLIDVPESLATVAGGNIRSRADGLDLVVLHTEAFPALLRLTNSTPPAAGGEVGISVQLQGKKVSETDWTNLKSHTGTLSNSGPNSTHSFNMGLSTSKTFTLDTDEELEFRFQYRVTAGSIAGGSIGPQSGEALSIEATGSVGTAHLFVHGQGTNEGKIVVIDTLNDVEEPVIDIENGVEYVGPTKLAGLDDGLSAAEQAAIRTKLDVPALADVNNAIYISAANTSVTDNHYTLTSTRNLTEYDPGEEFIFVAEEDSDGAVTVNVDAIGSREIHDSDGQLGDGDIDDGDVLRIVYDGTHFLLFESGSQNAAEVPTMVGNFDGILSSQPATVQGALNILDDVDAGDIPTGTGEFDGLLGSTDDSVQDALETLDDVDADDIPTETGNFDGLLSSSDDTVQDALETLDGVDASDIPMPTDNLDGVLDSGDNTVRRAIETLDDLDATDVPVDTGEFNGILSTSDDDLQTALDTIDNVEAEDIPTDASVFSGILGSSDDDVQQALRTLDDANAGDIPVSSSTWDGNLNKGGIEDVQEALDAIDDLDLVSGSGSNSVKSNQVIGGGNDILSLTPDPAITAYVDGQRFVFVSPLTTTGSVRVQVSDLAPHIVRTSEGVLTGGEIQQNGKYVLIYDTNSFLLVNPHVEEAPEDAEDIDVDADDFDGFLDSSHNDVQAVAERLDALNANNLPGNDQLRIRYVETGDVGGTANAITLTPNPAITALADGQYAFRRSHDVRR